MKTLNRVAGGAGGTGSTWQQSPNRFTPRRLWRWLTRLAVVAGIVGGATQVAAFYEERQHHQVQKCPGTEQLRGAPADVEAPAACTTPPADG